MTAVTVVVDDEHLERIDEVAAGLRNNGMEISSVLSEVGIITGSVPADRRNLLGTIPGVESIGEETRFQLPPPESAIQ